MPDRNGPSVGKRTLLAKSCTMCGHLKMASEFRKQTNRLWYQSECNKCKWTASNAVTTQLNNETRDSATKIWSLWTDEDFKVLEEMTARGCSAKEIAVKLERTVHSVYNMRKQTKKETAS